MMRFLKHSTRTLVALLTVAVLALPLLCAACKKPAADAPPTTDTEKAARKAAKMADPSFGGVKKGGR